MSNTLDPSLFNIDIIAITAQDVKALGEITSPAIFEASSSKFDKKGLFSTDIFGPVGSSVRNTTLGYIDLKVKVIHPFVFKQLCTLNSKYEDIISGKVRARFDRDKWDLVEDKSGDTGYSFFLSVLPRIRFSDNGSNERKYKINLIKKYCKEEYMSDKYLVLPAGLRDYRVDQSGTPTEDESNTLYRRLLAVTALLKTIKITDNNIQQIDPIRYKIQKSVNAIFDYFLKLLEGKHGFIQEKWAKRSIVNGTRNVLTPAPLKITNLNNVKISTNHSICGIYQYIKAIAPITMNRVKGLFINKFLNQNSNTATLVDPKTMKTSLVNIQVNKRDEWLSMEGLNKTMNKMKQPELRFEPVMIDGYYLQLLYDDGRKIKLFDNTRDITNEYPKEFIRPITYIELFYISIFGVKHKYPGFVTRYPVISLGGIFPCKIYVKTTYKARDVKLEMNGQVIEMDEYPIIGGECVESTSMPSTHLARAGADFDGDSCLGPVICRFKDSYKNIYTEFIVDKRKQGGKLPINNKKVAYNYGLIDLERFPREKLIEKKGNKEFYKVPKSIEVLTVWNGEIKWVKPESFSVHKNLKMINVKTHTGNTIQCSTDHTLVTLDDNLNYVRKPAKVGMILPKIRNGVNKFIQESNYKRHVMSNGLYINLNEDMGYLFGVMIGDGWVNYSKSKPNDFMIANVSRSLVEKVTEIVMSYGHGGHYYTKQSPHEFRGFDCYSEKHTWAFKSFAKLFKATIGHGAANKHLPQWWGNTCPKFRWGLLSGLIDTDGSISANGCVRFSTISKRLAYEVIALINSLGGNAGLTIHMRKHKTTFEYYAHVSVLFYTELKKNLKLYIKSKQENLKKLQDSPAKNAYTFTPNISISKLRELYRIMARKHSNSILYSRVSEAIKRAKVYGVGGYITRSGMLELLNTYWDILNGDPYWEKLLKILNDENIEWEVIREITPSPVTEAYDLTTPPYCTFVLQNGIVVYDTVSLNVVYTEDAIKEINDLLNSNKYYLSPEGSIAYSASDDIINLVLAHMTDKPSGIDLMKE